MVIYWNRYFVSNFVTKRKISACKSFMKKSLASEKKALRLNLKMQCKQTFNLIISHFYIYFWKYLIVSWFLFWNKLDLHFNLGENKIISVFSCAFYSLCANLPKFSSISLAYIILMFLSRNQIKYAWNEKRTVATP